MSSAPGNKLFAPRTIFTGDNLPIMRSMPSNFVDLIYLDPPFNKNRNFAAPIGSEAAGAAFRDTWTLDDVDEKWHAEVDEKNHALYTIIDAAGQAWHKSMKAYLIYMAIRLIEMKRILKDTGSIYLHCDPTASHYLKMVMDCVFGKENFRNEVVWYYQTGGVSKRWFGHKHDIILLYSKTDKYFIDLSRVKEKRTAEVLRRIASRSKNATRAQSTYRLPFDVWNIQALNAMAKERLGYPTQKPLALLDRIIKASSNESDLILDPFCGCATACIAAEKNGRRWIGIDISGKAIELVKTRMEKELGLFYDVDHRTDIMEPASIEERTDEEIRTPYNSRENKAKLFFEQDARCAICGHSPGVRMMEVDHIKPRSKGGTDDISNLQLLCGPCNRRKSARDDQAFRGYKAEEAMKQLAASLSNNDDDKREGLENALLEVLNIMKRRDLD